MVILITSSLSDSCHDIEYSTNSLSSDGGEMLHVHLHDTRYCPSVTKSSVTPKKYNIEYTSKDNQLLLSPLQGTCYNMAQKRLHHVATLTSKMEHNNKSLHTSFVSSPWKTSSESLHEDHCNKEYSSDSDAHHTKTQDSICSEYFEALSQLKSLIAQEKHFGNQVACQHGEKTHHQESKCKEQTTLEKPPNKAFAHAEQNPAYLHPHVFHVPTIHKHPLMTTPCKVTLDKHLGYPNTFYHTLKLFPDILADDDPNIISQLIIFKHIFQHNVADDNPTEPLLSDSSQSHPVEIVNKSPKPPNLNGELPISGDILCQMATSIIIGNKLWGSITTNVAITVGNILWGDTNTPIGMPFLNTAITITIGNNLWGDTSTPIDMPLFDADGIFMAHNNWGDYTTQILFFDFVLDQFHPWRKTANITQHLAHLDGIYTRQVDWGGTNSSLFCQFNPHDVFLHPHAHQVTDHIKFTIPQSQHKTNTADTLNQFIWYVRDILPFWHEYKDSTKSTQPTHHTLWGVINFTPYSMIVITAMRAILFAFRTL
ncbi:hypothetical protein ACA910_018455 [Epithemia clementina (nom. ined.)]